MILASSSGIPFLPLPSCYLLPRIPFLFHFLLMGLDVFLFILTVLCMGLFNFCSKVSFSPLGRNYLFSFAFLSLKGNSFLFAIGQSVHVCFHLQSATICNLDSKLLVIPLLNCRMGKV